ncbi:MAG TPA: Eco47II family restriction endonuclease [Candidatus Saccharimonadales bacterium]|nr:Eco47II family restriction endonuclease [Candidatus Saccharimonadales bacterium]
MALLPFISDEDLYRATRTLVDATFAAEKKVAANPYRNVIDPFSALVDAARQHIDIEAWMEQEKSRQIQKAFSNALGDFHQDILGAMPGWENAGRGGSYDVKNEELQVIAEVKNKHNTMNARSAISVYDNLQKHLDYSESRVKKAYLAEIVPKKPKPYELPFAPSERGTKRPARPDIVKTDGKSFYALASGDPDALRKLYDALPEVLGEILRVPAPGLSASPVFKELFDRAYVIK